MDGETTTKLFLYDDGTVIRLGEGQSPWLSTRLGPAEHGALMAHIREKLKQGEACDSGPSVIDGFAARLYEISRDDPPTVALYRLSLGNTRPQSASCAALAAAYDSLSKLLSQPAVRWRPPRNGMQGRRSGLPGEALLDAAMPANR